MGYPASAEKYAVFREKHIARPPGIHLLPGPLPWRNQLRTLEALVSHFYSAFLQSKDVLAVRHDTRASCKVFHIAIFKFLE